MVKEVISQTVVESDNVVGSREGEELFAGIVLDDMVIDDMVSMYFAEVRQTPLLKEDEETELAIEIEEGRKARKTLGGKAKGLDEKKKRKLSQTVETGHQAREHLINANARLVISVAKKYMDRGVSFLDLIQEGNIGLIRATKKFDYSRGLRFATYATWWVRQTVERAVYDQGRTVRIPVHKGDEINKLLKAQLELLQKLHRDPTVEELADRLESNPEKVGIMLNIVRRPLSLEAPIGDDEATLKNFIEDPAAEAPDNIIIIRMLGEDLERVLKGIPPREVRLLKLRFGLHDGSTYTLEEIGRKMGITRERVRQIEAQALRRLRRPTIKRELRDYLGE